MNNFQRRSALLLLHLHPPSFRQRFAAEMFLDYEDLCRSHGALWLSLDLFLSLLRQWGEILLAQIWHRSVAPRPAFLAGDYGLGFQAPLSPFELARGFALSVFLFSAFWSLEDPFSHPRDLLRMLCSNASPARVFASANPTPRHSEIEISDVTVVDVERGRLQPHRTVLIEDGNITSVNALKTAATKPGPDVLDGRGGFLIPGLWDMHTHITHTDVDFPLYLANGVLGIRNMGGVQDQVFAWQRQLKDGSLFGPLAFVSGPIVDGPHGPVEPASYGVRIANAEEGRAEVDTLKAKGADFVKVTTAFPGNPTSRSLPRRTKSDSRSPGMYRTLSPFSKQFMQDSGVSNMASSNAVSLLQRRSCSTSEEGRISWPKR